MFLHDVSNVSFESFERETASKKVILLYPWANYRNAFLSYFLDGHAEGLLYYRVPEGGNDVTTWVSGMLADFRITSPEFGVQLEAALPGGRAADIGEALAADMAQLSDNRVILYLDELDRVPQNEEFRQFLTALVDNLTGKTTNWQ